MVCREQTIRGYMQVAVVHVFVGVKRDVWVYPEAYVNPSRWKEDPHFKALLKNVRWWQGIKNRQEGLTKTMVAALRRKHASDAWDSHNQSLVDWLVIGLHTGYRRCEWAQEKEVSGKRSDFQIIEEVSNHRIYAVLPTDIVFLDPHKQALCDPFAVPLAQIAAVQVTWRFQKNGEHGQMVTFLANVADHDFRIIWAFLDVFRRFGALGVDPTFPIAIYCKCPSSQRASWFTTRRITKALKTIAAEVYSNEVDNEIHSPFPSDWGLHDLVCREPGRRTNQTPVSLGFWGKHARKCLTPFWVVPELPSPNDIRQGVTRWIW
jgi:hypothetical protein